MEHTLRILLIDDDAAKRAVLVSALQHTLPDSEVELVLKEHELSQALQDTVPDIVISAPCMPWMEGDALVRMLKKQWPTSPLLVVAAIADDAEAVRLCQAGADDYIAPVPVGSFGVTIRLAMIRATRQQQAAASLLLHLQRAQKIEADAALIGSLAHDFNNLLSTIMGYTDLTLSDVSRDSLVWRHLQAILAASKRACELVQQILALSQNREAHLPQGGKAVTEERQERPVPGKPGEQKTFVEHRRILLVEDDPDTRSMLKQMLERAGYRVTEARDGEEGLRLYRTTFPHVIITDILMPEKEGLALIRELQQESPRPKIIAISGGGHTGTLDFLHVAERLGAQRTLHKPLQQHELLEAIDSVLTGE